MPGRKAVAIWEATAQGASPCPPLPAPLHSREPWVQAEEGDCTLRVSLLPHHGHGKEKAQGGVRLWWHAAPPLAARGAVLALQGHLALGFACHRWDPLFLSPPLLIARFIPLHLGVVLGRCRVEGSTRTDAGKDLLCSVVQERSLLQPVISPRATLSLKSAARSGC